MARHWRFALACAFLCAFSIPVRAQTAPAAPPLTIFFIASTTNHASFASGDLSVTVDKKPAQILSVRPAKTDKLLFALLIDVSGSQMKDARPIRETATQIFQQLSSRGDVGYLGTFNDSVHLSAAPMAAGDVARTLADTEFGKRTALFDAIGACALQLSRQAHPDFPRRVIIVITDGGDNNSHLTPEKAKAAVEREGIAVFSLGIIDAGAATVEEQAGPALLRVLSHATGGEVVTPRTVGEAVTGLLSALDQQWEITIAPPAVPRGKLYKLSVKTTPKRVQIVAPDHIEIP